jgi:hypothetical protein
MSNSKWRTFTSRSLQRYGPAACWSALQKRTSISCQIFSNTTRCWPSLPPPPPHYCAARDELVTAAVKHVQQQLQGFSRAAVSFGMNHGDARRIEVPSLSTPGNWLPALPRRKTPLYTSSKVDLLRFLGIPRIVQCIADRS